MNSYLCFLVLKVISPTMLVGTIGKWGNTGKYEDEQILMTHGTSEVGSCLSISHVIGFVDKE